MMPSKIEHDNNGSYGDSNNGHLLRDIEAISKALYMEKPPPNSLISTSDVRSKSAGKTRLLESKSNPNLHKDNKSSSMWNWKKPLKALAHIRQHRFNICFFLHAHSIEGLPKNFDDISLCVHWKRKDEVLCTEPSRVLDGIAEFEETLMHKCSVYGTRSGPLNLAKYEVKIFLIYASVVGVPGLDIGKHWVDLTKLLPLTLEELEGEKSSGKWMTSFKLSGRANGATLNVSFAFSVIRDNLVESCGNINASDLISLTQHGPSTGEQGAGFHSSDGSGMLRRIGCVPSNLNHKSSLPVLPNLGLELSKSINLLYQKLNEGNSHRSAGLDIFYERLEPLKPKPELGFESASARSANECDNIEYLVIEKGIEMCKQDQFKLEETAVQTVDGSAVEIIDVDEMFKDEDTALDEETKYTLKVNLLGSSSDGVVIDDCKHEESCVSSKQSTMMESAFSGQLISESLELESLLAMDDFLEKENYVEVKSNYKASKVSSKSLSLDDITESVASDFLKMLGIDHDPFSLASDSAPESPRERLLREFEKEALASSNFILDFDGRGEQVEFGTAALTGSGCGEHYDDFDFSSSNFILDFDGRGEQVKFSTAALTGSGCGEHYDDFDFSSIIRAAEDEQESESQLLRNRRKAKLLEDLETESLMREWGLNEKNFQNSPRSRSNGFGSPIELPPEEPVELPPLGDGFGPFVQIKGGGYLRSMNPSLFRHSKNVGHLIMQVSTPVVLPAEMGSDITEILQSLALVGIQELSLQVNALMPLEDITGKTMQQVVEDSLPRNLVHERKAVLEHESFFWHDPFGSRREAQGFRFGWNCNNLSSGSIGGDMVSGYVSLEDFAPLAMDRIEALLIEGLRIQCGISDEEAPSSISPESIDNGDRFVGLMGLSITLDEWLRLDSGVIGDEDQINEHTLKILAAHHSKCIDLVSEMLTSHVNCGKVSSRNKGLLGGNLTVALMVLLRDPLRNYEPVGASMLALIQVERSFLPLEPKTCSMVLEREEEEDYEPITEELRYMRKEEEKTEVAGTPWFRVTEVHLAGLNTGHGRMQPWGTKTQQQSGIRWLLASGMGKANKHPFSSSKAIIRSFPQATRKEQTEDIFWSITSNDHNPGTNWKELAAEVQHVRNPNVIFRNESAC